MFYFGGMTLGYLEKPKPEQRCQNGENKATAASAGPPMERAPAKGELLSRANWFNLYW